MLDRIIDRLLALAPLGVLVILARQHQVERNKLVELLDRDRQAFRDERRELINRVQAPHMIPTGTRPADPPQPPADAHAGNGVTAAERARAAWTAVGRVRPPEPPAPERTDSET